VGGSLVFSTNKLGWNWGANVFLEERVASFRPSSEFGSFVIGKSYQERIWWRERKAEFHFVFFFFPTPQLP